MQDPRYPQLPMTQADWSGLLQGQAQAQPQVQANGIPDNAPIPRPPITAGIQPSASATPNYPTPPRRPANLTPQSDSWWDNQVNDTSSYPLTLAQQPLSNTTPYQMQYGPPNASLAPAPTSNPVVTPAIIHALLKTHQ